MGEDNEATLFERFEPYEAELVEVLRASDEAAFTEAILGLFDKSLADVPVVGAFARESLARLWARSSYAGMEAALKTLRAEQVAATRRSGLAAELEARVVAALHSLRGDQVGPELVAFAEAAKHANITVDQLRITDGAIGVEMSARGMERFARFAVREAHGRGQGTVVFKL